MEYIEKENRNGQSFIKVSLEEKCFAETRKIIAEGDCREKSKLSSEKEKHVEMKISDFIISVEENNLKHP